MNEFGNFCSEIYMLYIQFSGTLSEEVTESGDKSNFLSEKTHKKIEAFKADLQKAFTSSGKEWNNLLNKIWCFGPKRCGPNILFNLIEGHDHSFWNFEEKRFGSRYEYDSSFCNGFQLATLAGPMCEEPMMGVGFFIEDWKILDEPGTSGYDFTGFLCKM